jgi:hypothetical protein
MTESVNPAQLAALPFTPWGRSDLPADPGPLAAVSAGDAVQPIYASAAAAPQTAAAASSGLGSWLGGIGDGINSVINSFGSVMNGFIATINQQLNALGGSGGAVAQAPAAPEQTVSQASFSDWGDPHLSTSATTGAGQTIDGTWDDMNAHSDLLTSDSFAGGYQIATAVTSPNAQGVTLNSSADVYTQGGNVSVGLSSTGASITDYGQTIAMQAGQSYSLGNDEVASESADGSVVINQANAAGGSIATTLSLNGAGGVDVASTAANVDLGGYLLSRTDQPGAIG